MYHALFFHLSVDGHLDCFHFLAVRNMLLWIFVYKLISCTSFFRVHTFSFLLGVCLGVELLCHVITLFNFEGSKVSTSLITFVFYYRHPSVCEVVSHRGFNLYFSNDKWYWASFPMLIWLFAYFHDRNIY